MRGVPIILEWNNKEGITFTQKIELDDKYRGKIARELGDVLWYVANVAHEIGVSLETVARANVNKLNDRKVRGKISGNGDER